MSYQKPVLAILIVGIMLVGVVGPAAAHEWQDTVTQGPMELGISSAPVDPIAGMQTDFSARIADDEVTEGDENRLDWGGVTNAEVEVHINGPDGIHDHITTHIPEDEAHFHFSYVFPTDGTYTITVVTELEGEEYAFEFQRNVSLLPAEASGEEIEHLSEDMHAVNENVENVSEDVGDTTEKVEALQTQVNDLESQIDSLQTQIENHASDNSDDNAQAQVPGFGFAIAVIAIAVIVAIAVGRRY